jgi:hypothetical protein
MMVSAEYHADAARWATGIDLGDGEGSDERPFAGDPEEAVD